MSGNIAIQSPPPGLTRSRCSARAIRGRCIARHSRRAFTLTELMIVISIIAIVSGLGLSAFSGAVQMGRENRTRAMIEKIDQLIMERHEDYRTRAMPIRTPNLNPLPLVYATNPIGAPGPLQQPSTRSNSLLRLLVLRAMMRMELPDRRTDIFNFTTNPPSLEVGGFSALVNLSTIWTQVQWTGGSPVLGPTQAFGAVPPGTGNQPNFRNVLALQKSYARMAVRMRGGNPNNASTWTVLNGWTAEHEGAECLYLILSTMRDGDKSAIDYFAPEEIGDVDNDGMKEVLDGWGTPIEFLRWAPGYFEQPGLQTIQTQDTVKAPDPFDPGRSDPRWRIASTGFPSAGRAESFLACYALYPLIISAGPDRVFDIQLQAGDGSFRYAAPPNLPASQYTLPNDPYFDFSSLPNPAPLLGTPIDNSIQTLRPEASNGDGYLNTQDNITNHAKQG